MNEKTKKPGFRVRLFHLLFLFMRPMTLGVRVIVTDDEGQRVLLVRHGYVPGWHLPGGGVEARHTASQTVQKELEEETGLLPLGEPKLLAVYANRQASRRDHVLLYHCKKWERVRPFSPNREILEARFFPLDDLPQDITEATRSRLEEVFEDRPVSQYW